MSNIVMPLLLHFLLLLLPSSRSFYVSSVPSLASGEGSLTSSASRLSKPLIGSDGRIYSCSKRDFFAFERNGSIAWTLRLAYTCNVSNAPVHGGRGKIYLVAEDRVLKLNFLDVGTSPPVAEVFFGTEGGQQGAGEIIGLAVSTLSSSVFINIKNRGLFAYTMHRELLWSIGPVLSQFGYRLGCRKGIEDCYFASIPVIDQCEASIYISNTVGEIYSLSLRSPHFNWVQDLSSFDKCFTITPGNNGRLYVIVPIRALVLALDVFKGNILWQKSIGRLSTKESEPVVDSNGWISIGSLDGFLYSISPTGELMKFTKISSLDRVIQVSPFLDCSGYAVYISQTKMEGKVSQIIGEYAYVSAMAPKGVVITLVVPATGAVYWSGSYPGHFFSVLSQSDLQHFVVDEGTLLAFVTASGIGNPLPCRSKYQKLLSTCSQTRPRHPNIYTGNERTIIWFLFLESIILVVLAALVRFCCIFWRKKKLQSQNLGNFLQKRRSLQLKKKEFDRTITELEKKAAEDDTLKHEVIEEMGDLVREREGIERKLSTTYSLGKDIDYVLHSKSLLPVHDDGKRRSFSFKSAKKESVTLFPTLSDSSFGESSSDGDYSSSFNVVKEIRGKAAIEAEESSSDDDGVFGSSSKVLVKNSVFVEEEVVVADDELHINAVEEARELTQSAGRSTSLIKRRRNLSSID